MEQQGNPGHLHDPQHQHGRHGGPGAYRLALAPAHVLLAVDVPDDATVERLEVPDLPPGWDDFPAPPALAYMGDDWVRGKTALLLDVPSAASPYERCVLVNPLHPDIARCILTIFGPYDFDGRLNPNDP